MFYATVFRGALGGCTRDVRELVLCWIESGAGTGKSATEPECINEELAPEDYQIKQIYSAKKTHDSQSVPRPE